MKQLPVPTGSLPPLTKRGLFGGTLLELYSWSEAVRSGHVRIHPGDVVMMHMSLRSQMLAVLEFVKEWRDKIPDTDPRRDKFNGAMEMQLFSLQQFQILEHELTVSRQRNADLESKLFDLTMENKELQKRNDELIKMI